LDENREKEDNFFEMHAKTGQEAGNIAKQRQRCNGATTKQASIGPKSSFTGGKKLNTV
jgi:hypothetical protein